MLVLNDDTMICPWCWDGPHLEADPNKVPIGDGYEGTCAFCGRRDAVANLMYVPDVVVLRVYDENHQRRVHYFVPEELEHKSLQRAQLAEATIAELESAITKIISTARAGRWEGSEIPDRVAADIASAKVVVNYERRKRGVEPL